MPEYPWLLDNKIDTSTTAAKINAMITLGVPYADDYAQYANADLMTQANEIVTGMEDFLKKDGFVAEPDDEIIALIAYLQRLGTDIEKSKTAENE
jgi:cytochrome c oxidase cbb3-type subunit I/II